ncbi:uncharacterized protein LOC135125111 [Zophobas morio]|uniref:uncharacterized protein LOC135125111 n=1 Tax=Zophobas morio TaxID=2755281 RepID=UPI00308329DE
MNTSKLFTTLKRHFCNVTLQELAVQTFCDIQVNVPFKVNVKPLDVHEHHNCDRLKIELLGIKSGRDTLKHIQDGNNIKIFSSTEDYDENITCNIQAPVKANLNVQAHGDVCAGAFGGSKLVLQSRKGNIFVNKFQGDLFSVTTQNGDIVLKGAVVATDIKVVADIGNIKAKRLQGLDALVKTNEGNITVESSYCDKGVFEGRNGDFNLHNIHKNSDVCVKNGNLNLTGLDGHINAQLENVNADIQISRILENSKITANNGDVKLQLSDHCQDNTMFEIKTDNHVLDPSIRLIPSKNDKTLFLMPHTEQYKHLLVESNNGKVSIHSASWANMLKLKFNQNKD